MPDKKISTLEDLLVEELQDLLDAEYQLTAGFAKLARVASSTEMKSLIHGHTLTTQHHINRLDRIFEHLGREATSGVSKAMKGLLESGDALIQETEKSVMRDAVIILIAQRVGHYEIAGYTAARRHAILLGNLYVQSLLTEVLVDERETDHQLNKLAERLNSPLGSAMHTL